MKRVRNAVRTYLIEDNKVVCINNKLKNIGYYDIPGGKIEEGETKKQAAIREFKEETGIDIYNPIFKGNMVIECEDIDIHFAVFTVNEYSGKPQDFEENSSMWKDINELLNEEKRFPSTLLLEPTFFKALNDNKEFYIRVKNSLGKEDIEEIEFKYVN